MLLFVGLGNPGAGHVGHRHNVGFMAVQAIAARHGIGPWRRRFQGVAAEAAGELVPGAPGAAPGAPGAPGAAPAAPGAAPAAGAAAAPAAGGTAPQEKPGKK